MSDGVQVWTPGLEPTAAWCRTESTYKRRVGLKRNVAKLEETNEAPSVNLCVVNVMTDALIMMHGLLHQRHRV